MGILSELVFIPETQESIGYCMILPIFYSLPGGIVFNIQPDVEHSLVWQACYPCFDTNSFTKFHDFSTVFQIS